jgi:hypothetical protein
MECIEVTNPQIARTWINFPKALYKDDPNWICPLDIEIDNIFNPDSNGCFENGEAARWIITDSHGALIGRIAAFIDRRKVHLHDYPTGSAGFFECTDNQEAANMLFNTAMHWLRLRGMQAMLAPVNFGENYIHWGLLVDGFMPQGYGMQYHFPYYQKLFEKYGFRNYFEQYSFHRSLSEPFPGRMVKYATYIASRPEYTFEHFSYTKPEKYISDFVFAYNEIWSGFHNGYTPLQHSEIKKLLDEVKIIIDPEFIWFAYDKGKPAGFMMAFPDINQILVNLKNGRLNLLNKIRFLYYRRRAVNRVRVFIFGILPEYQNTGLVAALFLQLVNILEHRPGYSEIELSWVGDYNPKMLSMYDSIGAKKMKTHITYLYLFNKSATFRRFDNKFDGKLYR